MMYKCIPEPSSYSINVATLYLITSLSLLVVIKEAAASGTCNGEKHHVAWLIKFYIIYLVKFIASSFFRSRLIVLNISIIKANLFKNNSMYDVYKLRHVHLQHHHLPNH
jgi:hypothetical protein